MPAHLRTALTQTPPDHSGRSRAARSGTWQGLYLAEHRVRPHRREVVLHLPRRSEGSQAGRGRVGNERGASC